VPPGAVGSAIAGLTAPADPGTYTVIATGATSGLTASAVLTVVAPAQPGTTVTPGTIPITK
jgi:hypothetical protein